MSSSFANMEAENPFADPSVQNAASTDPAPNLDNYDPFSKDKTPTAGGPAVMQAADAAPPPNYYEPPPSYASTGAQQQISTADFQRRQEELEKRAKELERREEELKNSSYNARRNNWPPVPSFCPVQPCFYQDINVDIPVDFQKIVRYLYYLWIWHVSFLFINMAVALCYLFAGGSGATSTFGLSLFYFIIFAPASFVCWFRPAYNAFKNDSSFNFMIFFFVFFFQTIVSVFYAIGVGGMGACGLVTAISMLQASTGGEIFVGVLMLLTSFGFMIAAAGDVYLLMTIHKLYRTTGGSVAKAQEEFTSGVMNNEQVRQAAANAAAAGVRSQFANSGGANNAPGQRPAPTMDNRY